MKDSRVLYNHQNHHNHSQPLLARKPAISPSTSITEMGYSRRPDALSTGHATEESDSHFLGVYKPDTKE